MPCARCFGTVICHICLMPNKKQPGEHGRWCGDSTSHEALLCDNVPPTGRICVRPRASFYPPAWETTYAPNLQV